MFEFPAISCLKQVFGRESSLPRGQPRRRGRLLLESIVLVGVQLVGQQGGAVGLRLHPQLAFLPGVDRLETQFNTKSSHGNKSVKGMIFGGSEKMA
jgi:hypothetical protein